MCNVLVANLARMQLAAVVLCLFSIIVVENENTISKKWKALTDFNLKKTQDKGAIPGERHILQNDYNTDNDEKRASIVPSMSVYAEPTTIIPRKIYPNYNRSMMNNKIANKDFHQQYVPNRTVIPRNELHTRQKREENNPTKKPMVYDATNTCPHFNNPNPSICPEGFQGIPKMRCLLVLMDQPYPPACPYPHFLTTTEVLDVIDQHLSNFRVWMQVLRNDSSGFPEFEWIENGPNFGTVYQGDIANVHDSGNKNCLVRLNKVVYKVPCSERHAGLCIYSFEKIIISAASRVCPNRIGHCILGHYDLRNPTCFCQKLLRYQPTKGEFCQKLAEPVYPFQTQLLTTAVERSREGIGKCWIGLKKEKSTGKFKWESTNSDVKYTKWAKPYSCKYSEGALQFGKYDFSGWTLLKDRTIGCAICENTPTMRKPLLMLYRVPGYDDTLLLHVQNLDGISNFQKEYDIYCFSDEEDLTFKNVKKISNFTENGYRFFNISIASDRPAHYWCEAFQYSSFSVQTNILVSHWIFDYVYEFSLHVILKMRADEDPFAIQQQISTSKYIKKEIEKYFDVVAVRLMRGYFNETSRVLKMIMHVTIRKSSATATEKLENLRWAAREIPYVKNVLSSEICPAVQSSTPSGVKLLWPETRIGARTIPSNILCLDETRGMLPVTRKCEGDFLNGGRWKEPIGTCSESTAYAEITQELFDLLYQNVTAKKLVGDLIRITETYKHNESIDIHLIAKNFEKLGFLFSEDLDVTDYSKIINNMMDLDKATLKRSQLLLNSTDKILSSLDNVLNNETFDIVIQPKLITAIVNLENSNVRGVALYKETSDESTFQNYKLDLLFKNTSIDELTRKNGLEIAVMLPFDLLNKNYTKKLVVTAFFNDYLFHEEKAPHDVTKIISVSVPGTPQYFQEPVEIIFKIPKQKYKHKICSFWEYGINALARSIPGKWNKERLSKPFHGSFAKCDYFHMTHFGHLLHNEVTGNNVALEIITIICSSLSLIGVVPIYATALLWKTWRKRAGNIILLNFSTAITLQVIFTFLLYAVTKDGVLCKVIGILLHYTILSEFCWMLVIAILQYLRFVVVFKSRDIFIVRKTLFVGWGIPLFPVIITLCLSPSNYAYNEQIFCYINGQYLNFGLIFPIVVILTLNVTIFLMIMYNVSQPRLNICVEKTRDYKREILLAFLLFFILGLSWMFGLLGTLGAGVWSTYIFCITAPLRGLILFLYFILGNKDTRHLWKTRSKFVLHKMLHYLEIKR